MGVDVGVGGCGVYRRCHQAKTYLACQTVKDLLKVLAQNI